MVIEEEDLGLSLSLSVSSTTPGRSHSNENRGAYLPLNLMPPLVASAPASQFTHFETTSRIDSLPSPDWSSESCRAVEARSFLRGFDVNRPPASADDEEARVSSPNSTVSSLSGKRSERDNNGGDDHEIEAASCHGISDDEDGDTSRKKVRLSKDQSAILEETFKEHNTLNPKQKLALANRIGLRPRQVEVWFQNRRARTKLKQTEVDCEVLKSCCKQLTEENRRLQKEVRELRALKLSPQFYMQMPPPTTLTMCPSCERVSVPPSSSTARRPGDSRSKPAASLNHRSVPMNPRVTAPLPIRPIDALLTPP